MHYRVRIFVAEYSSTESKYNVSQKQNISNDVDDNPLWFQLVLTVKGHAYWQHYYGEQQHEDDNTVPKNPAWMKVITT